MPGKANGVPRVGWASRPPGRASRVASRERLHAMHPLFDVRVYFARRGIRRARRPPCPKPAGRLFVRLRNSERECPSPLDLNSITPPLGRNTSCRLIGGALSPQRVRGGRPSQRGNCGVRDFLPQPTARDLLSVRHTPCCGVFQAGSAHQQTGILAGWFFPSYWGFMPIEQHVVLPYSADVQKFPLVQALEPTRGNSQNAKQQQQSRTRCPAHGARLAN